MLVVVFLFDRPDDIAVPQDRHAVTDRHDLLYIMGNEQHGPVVIAEPVDVGVQDLPPIFAERRGGLIDDQQFRFIAQGPCDLHQFPLFEIVAPDPLFRTDLVQPEAAQDLFRRRIHLAGADDRTGQKPAFFSDKDVFGHGGIFQCVLLLAYHGDAFFFRIKNIFRLVGLPFELHSPFVTVLDPSHDRRQRRLAGSVFSDQSVDFSPEQLNMCILQGFRHPERFVHSFNF